ncbi:MAG: hypothetical protein AAF633_10825, partial [Chloroflexota bacterium]
TEVASAEVSTAEIAHVALILPGRQRLQHIRLCLADYDGGDKRRDYRSGRKRIDQRQRLHL